MNIAVREQLRAIGFLRWRLFVHSLRSTRGQVEAASRVIVGLLFSFGAIGGACALGGAAWYFVSQGNPQRLAFLFWPVFAFWQLFPIFATAFSETADPSYLLRFPLSLASYVLLRLAYGAFDPATVMGSTWLTGILIGIGIAAPHNVPIVAIALASFALFNILLSRTIFAWLERWLAQRKTREILGVLFLLVMLSFQLIGPMLRSYRTANKRQVINTVERLDPVQRVLPPGLVAESAAAAYIGDYGKALEYLCGLGIYCGGTLWVLTSRLRKEYGGENLSEVDLRTLTRKATRSTTSWEFSGLSGPIGAVLEKELRYLSRSGPMLFTLIVPLFMLVIFRSNGGFPGHRSELAFPAVAAYTLILVTNLVYNNFGSDGAGIQLYFAAPISFRSIVIGKNLAHASVILLQILIAWIGVSWLYRRPPLDIVAATFAAMTFAAPINFAVGNLLSIYFPKRIDASAFGRQRASPTTVLASFGVQLVVMGTAAIVIWRASGSGNFWMATVIFLALAAVAVAGYSWTLSRVNGIALNRRENLLGELVKSSS
jgi:ABC-2 type transport system permease protein